MTLSDQKAVCGVDLRKGKDYLTRCPNFGKELLERFRGLGLDLPVAYDCIGCALECPHRRPKDYEGLRLFVVELNDGYKSKED